MSRCRTRTCIYREAWLALAVAARTRRATRRHVRCAREQPRREEKSGEATCPLCRSRLLTAPPVEAEEEEELDLDSDLLLLMAYVHGGGGWFWSP